MDILKEHELPWYVDIDDGRDDDWEKSINIFDKNDNYVISYLPANDLDRLLPLFKFIVNAVNSLHTSEQGFEKWQNGVADSEDYSYLAEILRGDFELANFNALIYQERKKAWLASNVGRKEGLAEAYKDIIKFSENPDREVDAENIKEYIYYKLVDLGEETKIYDKAELDRES